MSCTRCSKPVLTKKHRLDLELVRRGLTGSRAEAKRAIEQGQVTVRGVPADRASSMIDVDDPIALIGEPARFVSRGGNKLDHALTKLDVVVEGRKWLDAGASTGGFTDRLLGGGADQVAAVDVGYGQFDWRLRNDSRVVLLERTNVRDLQAADLPWSPDAIVADLSFISLRLVVPVFARLTGPDSDHVLLVKPQFEVGRALAPKGVVREPSVWQQAVESVVDSAVAEGLGLVDVALAEPPGPAGNREFFVHLKPGATGDRSSIAREVAEADG